MNYLIANDVIGFDFVSEKVKNQFADFELQDDLNPIFIDMSGSSEFSKRYAHLSFDQVELLYSMQRYFDVVYDKGKLLVHALTIVVDDWGYVLFGRAGSGKSTMAHQWIDYFDERAFILSDDRTILSVENNTLVAWKSPWSKISFSKTSSCYRIKSFAFISKEKDFEMKELSKEKSFIKIADEYPVKLRDDVLRFCNVSFNSVKCWEIKSNITGYNVDEVYKVMNK